MSSHNSVFEKLNRKPYPKHLSVDIHTYCDGSCIFCPYHRLAKQGKVPWGKMKWSLFERIIKEYAELMKEYNFVGSIGFCLMGEPFIEKEIVKYTKLVLDHGINHDFTTNAALMDKKVIDGLIDIGYSGQFKISCHGIRPATIKKVMGLDVNKMLKNIDYLLERYPQEKISIRAFPYGWEKGEKKELKAYWKKRNVSCGGGLPFSRGGLIEEISQPPLKTMRGCSDNRPLKHMVISYNGDVLFCCFDMERKVVIGNLQNQSLVKIWNSPSFAEHLEWLYFNKTSSQNFICKHCELANTWLKSHKIYKKLFKIPFKLQRSLKKKHYEHLNLDK